MLKRLILFIAIFSLFCAIQCNPTPVDRARSQPSTGFKRDGRNRPSSRPKREEWDRRGKPSSRPKRDGRDRPSSRPKRDGLDRRGKPSSRPKRDGLVSRGKPSSRPKRDELDRRGKPSSRPKRDELASRGKPSSRPKRDGLEARGICDFGCPQENLAGTGLSAMYEDTGRLYCKYDVEGMAGAAFCMYNRNTGDLFSAFSPSNCDQQATFHCPGTKNDQEDLSPSPPQDSRSMNLPQFVKARSMARRAAEEDNA